MGRGGLGFWILEHHVQCHTADGGMKLMLVLVVWRVAAVGGGGVGGVLGRGTGFAADDRYYYHDDGLDLAKGEENW